MADVKEKTIALVKSVALVDLKTVATTNLFTVPQGKTFIPTHVVLRSPSLTAAGGVITLGQTGAKTDFLAAQTLTNLSAATKVVILQPVPNATPVAVVAYTAALIFCIDVTTGVSGASCTVTIDIFGYLF